MNGKILAMTALSSSKFWGWKENFGTVESQNVAFAKAESDKKALLDYIQTLEHELKRK